MLLLALASHTRDSSGSHDTSSATLPFYLAAARAGTPPKACAGARKVVANGLSHPDLDGRSWTREGIIDNGDRGYFGGTLVDIHATAAVPRGACGGALGPISDSSGALGLDDRVECGWHGGRE